MPSRNAPPHKKLLRIEPHSFPPVNLLELSFHFVEGVHAMFAVKTPPITALLLSVPHVGMTEQSKSSHENKQSE